MNSPYWLTADVGGTFTDLVLHDDASQGLATSKLLTTPEDPSRAILEGAAKLIGQANRAVVDMAYFMHATTLVTNTIIERSGACTGLLMTEGFRDIIEMATETRYDIYDLGIELPMPLVPRTLRREIAGRITSTGVVLAPIDLVAARATIVSLLREGVTAIAVCFLHSYVNPAHEQEVGNLIRVEFPHVAVSLSSDVQPEIREYERASTTVANAYTQPKTKDYLKRLEDGLRTNGFAGSFNVMLSSGGLTSGKTAARLPIKILESGPAAGVEAACALGMAIGIETLVSFDMGGTTAKVGLVEDGVVSLSSQLEVARLHRFKKGSGLIVKSPTVELIEIGAGGGSIARVDQYGLLRVGPQSAGSVPGPACYGRGGVEATVTDSDLVLGYLDPDDFAGGDIVLDLNAATAAIGRLADKLKLSNVETAWGVHEIANENMATAARIHLVERGKDPGAFTFVAFGGAGPSHAQGVAGKLGIKRVIMPRNAGVMSAVGLLAAPMSFDVIKSEVLDLSDINWSELRARFERLADEARSQLTGVPANAVQILRSADMRYRGQGSEIAVQFPSTIFDKDLNAAVVSEAFSAAYDRLYGRHIEGAPIQLVNLRVRAVGAARVFDFLPIEKAVDDVKAHKIRRTYFPKHGYIDTRVYLQADLRAGHRFTGPAIVQSREFSALIAPGQSCSIDLFGNLDIAL
jgi:5-oxoprolinase (ATP-hydrolysing)/N-methylhydantoinase A